MEKKSTKIAYFIALAVVIVALIIAKVANDGSWLCGHRLGPVPPVVAIALALISKEVYSSLFLGCLVGALLLADFSPWQTVVNFIGAGEGVGMINAIDISILIFLVILGIMVDLMNKAGGSAAFGRWATKAVKTRSGAQLMTMLLGVLIFIDDYFNCLTVGAVMRPVTESHHISGRSWPTSLTLPPLPCACWPLCPPGLPPLHPMCPMASRLPHQHVPEPDSLELLLHPDSGDGHRHLPAEH